MQYELEGFCCCDGEVLLIDSKMPKKLYDFFTYDSIKEKKN